VRQRLCGGIGVRHGHVRSVVSRRADQLHGLVHLDRDRPESLRDVRKHLWSVHERRRFVRRERVHHDLQRGLQ
jgi:hypothetical protein